MFAEYLELARRIVDVPPDDFRYDYSVMCSFVDAMECSGECRLVELSKKMQMADYEIYQHYKGDNPTVDDTIEHANNMKMLRDRVSSEDMDVYDQYVSVVSQCYYELLTI